MELLSDYRISNRGDPFEYAEKGPQAREFEVCRVALTGGGDVVVHWCVAVYCCELL